MISFFTIVHLIFWLVAMGDFGRLGVLPSVEDVQERCNAAFDNLFHRDKDGTRRPYVCSFCDEFIMCAQEKNFFPINDVKKKKDLFEWTEYLHPDELTGLNSLVDNYKFKDVDKRVIGDASWLNDLCLSPRGVIGQKIDKRGRAGKFGFSCCNDCKHAISNNFTPFNAIINKNYVGEAPSCLKELTEVELAFLTPVKGYGYCFHWAGGAQKMLTGSMTFMRVEKRSIAKASAQLEAMGLKNHIVVLLSGKMTRRQRDRAQAQIRVDKIITAVKWLCDNHVRWKGINYDEYVRELHNCVPTVIDHSDEVASENQNIEQEELFSCYYPDGAVNPRQGGFNNPDDFKQYIEQMKATGFDIQLQINLEKQFLDGKDGDQLISSSLLQFPYGIGGLKEDRRKRDGSSCPEAKLEPFLSHLTKLSDPTFQLPMFQLVVYSLCSKLRLLRKSRLQLRSEKTVEALANGLTANDVRSTARGRQVGDRTAGTVASRALLDGVDGMSRGVAHSNEAAKQARSNSESMQHLFGIPSVFLTVTFDDENSLLVQVLSGEDIDDDRDVKDVPDSELAERALLRKELRLKYPGIGALNFEMLFQIVMEEVVGWDMRRNCATDRAGLFGKCMAVLAAYEEQGRLTVHSHLTVWIEGFQQLRKDLFFGSRQEQREAAKLIPEYSEHICTTNLIGASRKRDLLEAFDHECAVPKSSRELPDVISDQGLRDLRHRMAYKNDSCFATCSSCTKPYTYEDLAGLYCQEIGGIKGNEPDVTDSTLLGEVGLNKCRMHAMCIEYQKNKDATTPSPDVSLAINAAYNCHASCHVSGCFKCQKKKKGRKKHVCSASPDCECRFRLPDRSRQKSCVRFVKETNPWFEWNGTEKEQPIIEVLPKRQKYDCFQNVSCRAISEAKFTCNSNVSVITDGPVGVYQVKYSTKDTQDDDTAAYAAVEHSIKSMESRVHEDDKKEAARIICRAAFAHNKRNVIGPSFASFLTRHDSRFYFSHTFHYCPMHDLFKILEGGTVSANVKIAGSGHYFENQALHYLCRPKALEDLSAREFFEEYYVVDMPQAPPKPGQPDLRFLNHSGHYQHPSAYVTRTNPPTLGQCRQGVGLRDTPTNIKVTQYSFPDTARFKANILTCANEEICDAMETYAKWLLHLLYPYRCKKDLEPLQPWSRFPYVMKLREVNANDYLRHSNGDEKLLFKDRNLQLLQNIQNCAYNSTRYKLSVDDLQSETSCFVCTETCLDPNEESDSNDEKEDDDEDDLNYEAFLSFCEDVDTNDHDATQFPRYLQNYSFKSIRSRGTRACGYDKHIPKIDVSSWVSANEANRQWVLLGGQGSGITPSTPAGATNIPRWKVRDILKVLLRKSTAKVRPAVFKRNPTVKVGDANGSFESIQEWAKAAGLDPRQKRAFEAIVASFVLTFHDFQQTDYNDESLTGLLRTRARHAKTALIFLTGTKDGQLIMLLHGPGGSGKSLVISMVICYAKEFCDLLGHPFTARTIVITAMSGVAATLIHGETTHKAMALNKDGPDEDEIEAWTDTRLVIIDESSFATAAQASKIEMNARTLKGREHEYYGGLNIVYAGDFSQLEPPRAKPLYFEGQTCPAFHGVLNAFIELDGQHRFKDDPAYGEMMLRFRNGVPTRADIDKINDNCLIREGHSPGDNVPVAVYRNRNRDAINSAMFEEYCTVNKPADPDEVFEGALLLLMDNLEMRDGVKTYVRITSSQVKLYFYSQCGEDDCKTQQMSSKRVDPVLKLYPSCPLMYTENSDVANGQANGSRVTLKSVNIKNGETPMVVELACGTKVHAYYASQVRSLTVRHEDDDICPPEFDVASTTYSFTAKLQVYEETRKTLMKGNQFCLISNGVTTGHKLQGCTLFWLAVFEYFYGQNWVYVILSRVRTLEGLYLSKPLDHDLEKYRMSRFMKKMIHDFQERIGLQIPTPQEYQIYMDLDKANRQDRGVQDALQAADRDEILRSSQSETDVTRQNNT